MTCYKNSSNFSWVKGESERKDHSYHNIFIINPIKIQLSNLYFLTLYFIQTNKTNPLNVFRSKIVIIKLYFKPYKNQFKFPTLLYYLSLIHNYKYMIIMIIYYYQ